MALGAMVALAAASCGGEEIDREVAEMELGEVDLDGARPEAAGDVAGPFGPVAQVAGFDLDVTAVGDDVQIDFDAQPNATSYSLWESSDPYFAPGDAGSVVIATGGTESFTIAGAGAAEVSRYWRITSDASDTSTTAGMRVQPLVSGYNNVGMVLLEAGLNNAEDLNAAYPEFTEIWTFNDNDSGFNIWRGMGEANFTWDFGAAPTVFNAGPPTSFRLLGLVPVDADLAMMLPTNGVVLAAPLSLEPTDADGLLEQMPGVHSITTLDTATQTLVHYYTPGWGTNFAIEPGQGLWITANVPIQWPPGYVPPPPSACDGRVEPHPTPGSECVLYETADGVVDLTADVMAAIPGAPYELFINEDATLTLCEGTYPLSVELAGQADVTITGAGSELTVIDLLHAGGFTHLGVRADSTGLTNISGLTIRGALRGIQSNIHRSNMTLDDIGVELSEYGVVARHKNFIQATNIWARNNTQFGFNDNGRNGLGSSARAIPGDGIWDNVCAENNGRAGMRATQDDGIVITNSEFRNNGEYQIFLSYVQEATVTNTRVHGNDDAFTGFLLRAHQNPDHWQGMTATLDGLYVTDNHSSGLAAGGIVNQDGYAVVECTNSVVEDNTPGNLDGLGCTVPQ
ncbi:MAG: right-handed parallel beta-helix repeat-containing protein [Myxococcota bacterium]